MRRNLKQTLSIFLLLFGYEISAQTLNEKSIIISTNLPHNLTGIYNIGMEYFLPFDKNQNAKASFALNGGFFSTDQLQESIKGYSFVFETNLYTDLMLPKNWNEYGGIKFSYGSFETQINKNSNQSYFFGISTGIQPVIAKVLTLKISSDLGYVHNGLTNTLLFNNRRDMLYSGFVVNFDLGVGIRIK